MALKKYNNLLTSGRWSNKYHNDAQILSLVGVAQNLADDSKKSSDKFNKDPNKGEPAYIRYLPPWVLEDPKGEWETKPRMDINIGGASNTALTKANRSATS